jgi:serine/threonine protein kinase
MAPEILNQLFYNHKVDIWSFGTSMFEALIGTPPFLGKNKDELISNVNKGIVKIPKHIDLSSCCLDFLGKCLSYDP